MRSFYLHYAVHVCMFECSSQGAFFPVATPEPEQASVSKIHPWGRKMAKGRGCPLTIPHVSAQTVTCRERVGGPATSDLIRSDRGGAHVTGRRHEGHEGSLGLDSKIVSSALGLAPLRGPPGQRGRSTITRSWDFGGSGAHTVLALRTSTRLVLLRPGKQ